MDLEGSSLTMDPIREEIAKINVRIMCLKTDIKLIEMENKNTRDELSSDMKLIKRINKLLLGFVVVFEACLIIALR